MQSDYILTAPLIGEKIVPIPQENHIGSSPLVNGCVMFGREREQPGVLVEPRAPFDPNDEPALISFRNSIWWVHFGLLSAVHR